MSESERVATKWVRDEPDPFWYLVSVDNELDVHGTMHADGSVWPSLDRGGFEHHEIASAAALYRLYRSGVVVEGVRGVGDE